MSIHIRPACRLLVAATVAAPTACATMTRPRMNRVAVASDPPLAVITADGDPVGETPVTVPLSRRDWWGRGRGGVVLKQFMDNEGFKRWMTDRVFELACKQAGAAAATTRSAP